MAKIITINCKSEDVFKEINENILVDLRNALENNTDDATKYISMEEEKDAITITITGMPPERIQTWEEEE